MALTDCLERIIPNYGRVLMQSKPKAIAALPIPLDVGKLGLWQTIFKIWCWRYGYDLTQSNAKTSVALTEKLSMINVISCQYDIFADVDGISEAIFFHTSSTSGK